MTHSRWWIATSTCHSDFFLAHHQSTHRLSLQIKTNHIHSVWENKDLNNYLQYHINVGPSPEMIWHDVCHGIYDQISHNCRDIDCHNLIPGCWCDRKPEGAEGENRSFNFWFPMRKWDAGEDNRHCVTQSIIKALYGANVLFHNGMCYQRTGSFQRGTVGAKVVPGEKVE